MIAWANESKQLTASMLETRISQQLMRTSCESPWSKTNGRCWVREWTWIGTVTKHRRLFYSHSCTLSWKPKENKRPVTTSLSILLMNIQRSGYSYWIFNISGSQGLLSLIKANTYSMVFDLNQEHLESNNQARHLPQRQGASEWAGEVLRARSGVGLWWGCSGDTLPLGGDKVLSTGEIDIWRRAGEILRSAGDSLPLSTQPIDRWALCTDIIVTWELKKWADIDDYIVLQTNHHNETQGTISGGACSFVSIIKTHWYAGNLLQDQSPDGCWQLLIKWPTLVVLKEKSLHFLQPPPLLVLPNLTAFWDFELGFC